MTVVTVVTLVTVVTIFKVVTVVTKNLFFFKKLFFYPRKILFYKKKITKKLKIKMWWKTKTHTVMNLKNLNCDETQKSCIWETPNLSTDADSITNIFFSAGGKKEADSINWWHDVMSSLWNCHHRLIYITLYWGFLRNQTLKILERDSPDFARMKNNDICSHLGYHSWTDHIYIYIYIFIYLSFNVSRDTWGTQHIMK